MIRDVVAFGGVANAEAIVHAEDLADGHIGARLERRTEDIAAGVGPAGFDRVARRDSRRPGRDDWNIQLAQIDIRLPGIHPRSALQHDALGADAALEADDRI